MNLKAIAARLYAYTEESPNDPHRILLPGGLYLTLKLKAAGVYVLSLTRVSVAPSSVEAQTCVKYFGMTEETVEGPRQVTGKEKTFYVTRIEFKRSAQAALDLS